ncbi:hypothetical protein SETIT_9G281400v2 [Setaria italica]|uniref:Uncharacterized protein n=1 Tax=Setaria italica TaxID=4555 RepID=A0A368SN91_SETIT|nr:hypothetical protein SETIT_9G281400v2 [Setaria italica]
MSSSPWPRHRPPHEQARPSPCSMTGIVAGREARSWVEGWSPPPGSGERGRVAAGDAAGEGPPRERGEERRSGGSCLEREGRDPAPPPRSPRPPSESPPNTGRRGSLPVREGRGRALPVRERLRREERGALREARRFGREGRGRAEGGLGDK